MGLSISRAQFWRIRIPEESLPCHVSHLDSRTVQAGRTQQESLTELKMKRKVCAGEQAEVDTTKKRKREKKSENVPKKNGKPASKTEVDKLESKLNLSNPLSLIKSILYPHTPEFFQEEHWEKKPLHIKRNNSEYYGKLFDMASFFDILKKNKLHYEIDINVCRYVDGEKETMNGEEVAKASEVKNMIQKQNATVQFHQPQRFSVRHEETYFLFFNCSGLLVVFLIMFNSNLAIFKIFNN